MPVRDIAESSGERGAALAELLVSILILAFAISAVAGVMFTTKLRASASEDQEAAVRHVDMLLQDLRNYVTADTSPIPEAPGAPAWHLPSDQSCVACWALSSGVHDVTPRLPAALRDPPRSGRLTYTVTDVVMNGETLPQVTAELRWDRVRQ
ncbi:MAG: hypothetical protein A2X36_05450 [Elusimicrobia bacterium GWA2_69_24]|nr:MAG: hypothetical protein A2X36_05450 [Elusimicrobia bacterium GWA2_69_24]HBL16002.1 hypothetical protein [Elusimicrobiota bacterium]